MKHSIPEVLPTSIRCNEASISLPNMMQNGMQINNVCSRIPIQTNILKVVWTDIPPFPRNVIITNMARIKTLALALEMVQFTAFSTLDFIINAISAL